MRRYMTMLLAGKKAPASALIKQRLDSRYPYRIFDGAHRVRAAKNIGQKTIEANVIAEDP